MGESSPITFDPSLKEVQTHFEEASNGEAELSGACGECM